MRCVPNPIDQQSRFRRSNHPTKARVTYDASGLVLELDTRGAGWQNCVVIPNAILPDNLYLGFSAETGDVAGTLI